MMQTIVAFLSHYGAVAIFVGCLFEGETFAIAGGFFAHQGLVDPVVAGLTAFVGAFLGDLALFLAGQRLEGLQFVQKLTRRRAFGRAKRLIARHPILFVLGNRYIYGLRTVGGLAAGMSGVKLPLFLLLNAVSAIVWAAIFISLGWVFGLAAHRLLGQFFGHHKALVLVGLGILALAGGCFWLFRRSRNRLPTE